MKNALIPSSLHEFHLRLAGQEWVIQHTGLILTRAAEAQYLDDIQEQRNNLPYGVALWPSSIALAHEIAARHEAFAGTRVLELGAGTGLPGIVAASLGAHSVVQTDREEVALLLCQQNAQRNEKPGRKLSLEHRPVDWANWQDGTRYDWILGADILYAESMHPHLQQIFQTNLAPGGRILLSDPFRAASLRLLEQLEEQGWKITFTRWNLGDEDDSRPVGVFDLSPPSFASSALAGTL